MAFQITSDYCLQGDQPQAVEKLVNGIREGHRFQTLLGATGTGKTFTMANVIQQVERPTLVMAHNKTLAAQPCSEFRESFPNNAAQFFVSYYDNYQPHFQVRAASVAKSLRAESPSRAFAYPAILAF